MGLIKPIFRPIHRLDLSLNALSNVSGDGVLPWEYVDGISAYDPSQELIALLDQWAQDEFITEAGTGVSAWLDRVSRTISLVQATDANRPSYLEPWREHNGVDFNGTSDRLAVTLAADQLLAAGIAYTVLCYGELDALKSATQSIIDFGNGRSWIMFETANAGNPIGIFDGTAYRSVGVDPSTGPHLWEWSVSGGAGGLTVYQDGVALGTSPDVIALQGLGGSTFLGSIDGGGSAYFDGKLGRLLVYRGILDAAARARVHAWGQMYYDLP